MTIIITEKYQKVKTAMLVALVASFSFSCDFYSSSKSKSIKSINSKGEEVAYIYHEKNNLETISVRDGNGEIAKFTINSLVGKCDDGDFESCSKIGIAYIHASRIYQSADIEGDNLSSEYLVKSFGHFKKACEGGYAGGCFELGLIYEMGRDVDRDMTKALSFYKQGCDVSGDADCNNPGIDYINSSAVTQNLAKAASLFFELECVAGVTCSNPNAP